MEQCAGNLEQLFLQDFQESCNVAPLASLGAGSKIARNLAILVSNGKLVGEQVDRVGQVGQDDQNCKIADYLGFPTKLDQDCKIAKSPRFTLQVTVLDSRHNVSLSVLLQLLLQKATNFYTNNNNNYYYYYDDDDDGSYY